MPEVDEFREAERIKLRSGCRPTKSCKVGLAAALMDTDRTGADLTGCVIHSVSAWPLNWKGQTAEFGHHTSGRVHRHRRQHRRLRLAIFVTGHLATAAKLPLV